MGKMITLNPHEMDDAKVRRMFAFDSEQLTEHPTAFYRAGFDALAATGRIVPQMDFVLLRAITSVEIYRQQSSSIILAGNTDRINQAQAFEIIAIGPVVRELQRGRWWRELMRRHLGRSYGANLVARNDAGLGIVRLEYPVGSLDHLQPGMHCVSVASAADALDPEGDGIFQLVRACFIPAAWDPVGASHDVVDVLNAAHVKYLEDEERITQLARAAQQRHAAEVIARREYEQKRLEAWERGEPFDGQERPQDAEQDEAPAAPSIIIPRKHRSA